MKMTHIDIHKHKHDIHKGLNRLIAQEIIIIIIIVVVVLNISLVKYIVIITITVIDGPCCVIIAFLNGCSGLLNWMWGYHHSRW